MEIRKGDEVIVITGEDKGKTGIVTFADPTNNTVIVDGINIVKKHKKARKAQDKSSIVAKSAPINASNVMAVCGSCGEGTRIGHKVENGAKTRICKKCGAALEAKKSVKASKAKEVKAEKKTDKKPEKKAGKKADVKAEDKKAEVKTGKKPVKKTDKGGAEEWQKEVKTIKEVKQK